MAPSLIRRPDALVTSSSVSSCPEICEASLAPRDTAHKTRGGAWERKPTLHLRHDDHGATRSGHDTAINDSYLCAPDGAPLFCAISTTSH
jgi:hypothetical protein